ncbi:MAG: DUF3253 domain-containing protein [Alcaligenaceae bacterium]|nr:MAG: DUF3253 domain-containing protein [Alcaligenaceae bacterium]
MSDARDVVIKLLLSRDDRKTVCPSEAARSLAKEQGSSDWRGFMPAVHSAVDALAAEGVVLLSWKGRPIDVRTGPYRIKRKRD